MYMTEQQRMAEARVLASTWDKLTRNPKRITPTAPWIIPALMLFVACFAFVCLVIKLCINYLSSKSSRTKKYGLSEASSPELPMTPTEDQASMATTASMKTRDGSSRLGSRRSRLGNMPPAVSLYQIKHMQSPSSTTSSSAAAAAVAAVAAAAATSKTKHNKAAMKALAKAAKSDANKSRSNNNNKASDDADNNSDENNSPCELDQSHSQHSGDTDDLQEAGVGALMFGGGGGGSGLGSSRMQNTDEPDSLPGARLRGSSRESEVHIVQIRDLEDNLQHSQPSWPQAESEI